MEHKDILISFNNTYQSPGYPSLGVYNTGTCEIKFLDLPPEIPQTGILGLAVSSKYIFAGLQYSYDATKAYRVPPVIGLEYNSEGVIASLNPNSLLVFDIESFKLLHQYEFLLVRDVHSFLLTKDEMTLYVVSTGTDEVVQLDLDGYRVINETVFWRPMDAAQRNDHHHINSICDWNGDILVSGFGKKEIPDDWNSAKNGFIYNISQSETIIDGLQQPHSLLSMSNDVAYCESKSKRIRFIHSEETISIGGYTRGLCEVNGALLVGTSARRNKSKSTGKAIINVEGHDAGCTITCVQSSDGSIINSIDINNYAHEIYEMVVADHTDKWPFKPYVNYKEAFQHAWDQQKETALKELEMSLEGEGVVVIIDDKSLGIDYNTIAGQQLFSFIEKDGVYWGPPADDHEGIREVKRMAESFHQVTVAIFWPSFWWLITYPQLQVYLNAGFEKIFENTRLIIFSHVQ